MGAVSGMLGLAGGINGTGNQGAQSANVLNPATTQQATDQYNQAQNALQQQQSFVNATQAQNGLGNQSQVYNQLQGVVNGTGPNPAQAQLAQSTGANVANQAALMAGQRGSGANAGLIARQAAQQGANTQQQAAGQAATLQANQSLNALSSAGNLASTQASQQANALNSYNQQVQGEQGQVLGAIANQNNANTSNQSNINQVNAGAANAMTGLMGSALGGASQGAASALMKANGGQIPYMAPGGPVPQQTSMQQPMGPQSLMAQHLLGVQSPAAMPMAQGGKVPVMLSPGEKKLTPEQAKAVAAGKASPMALGKTVPGNAPVKGAKNDYANDIVKDSAEPGTVILPRSVTQSKNPEAEGIKFVQALYAKKGNLPKKGK